MASTKVTKVGYGSKLAGSIKGIFGGFILIILAIGLLWWNEGNSVKEIKKVKEGKTVLQIANAKSVDPQNEGALIHVSGFATTYDTLADPRFGIKENAIKLDRVVEMYQYKENKKKEEKENLGGSTTVTETFTYEEVWSSDLINSDNFYENWRINPKAFINREESWRANHVTLDDYILSEGILNSMSAYEPLYLNEQSIDTTVVNIQSVDTTDKAYKLSQGMVYYGKDAQKPEIGDERISYRVLYPQEVSIIAEQYGKSFKPYKTKVGKNIQLVMKGELSADEMWDTEETKNTMIRWVLRLLGVLMMFMGFSAILKPLAVAGSVIPLLGSIVGLGTSLISGVLTFCISLLVFAVAWIFYRPILGIVLLLLAIGGFILAKKYLFKSSNEEIKETE